MNKKKEGGEEKGQSGMTEEENESLNRERLYVIITLFIF